MKENIRIMNKYPYQLNLILFLFVLISSTILFPWLGYAYCIGAVIGALMTGGVVFVDFTLSSAVNRDEKWILVRYLSKHYLRETILNVAIAILAIALSFLFWRFFFIMLFGYMMSVVVFILIEWGWKIHISSNR